MSKDDMGREIKEDKKDNKKDNKKGNEIIAFLKKFFGITVIGYLFIVLLGVIFTWLYNIHVENLTPFNYIGSVSQGSFDIVNDKRFSLRFSADNDNEARIEFNKTYDKNSEEIPVVNLADYGLEKTGGLNPDLCHDDKDSYLAFKAVDKDDDPDKSDNIGYLKNGFKIPDEELLSGELLKGEFLLEITDVNDTGFNYKLSVEENTKYTQLGGYKIIISSPDMPGFYDKGIHITLQGLKGHETSPIDLVESNAVVVLDKPVYIIRGCDEIVLYADNVDFGSSKNDFLMEKEITGFKLINRGKVDISYPGFFAKKDDSLINGNTAEAAAKSEKHLLTFQWIGVGGDGPKGLDAVSINGSVKSFKMNEAVCFPMSFETVQKIIDIVTPFK